ncbi:MAG: O-antigen ligase family protein [Ignavibacteriaceae bacterium]
MKSANSLIKKTMFREIFSLKSLVIGLFFALLLSPFLNIIHYLLIPVFIIALYILEKIDLILLLIISSFLVISRNLSSDFRDLLQYGNFIFLGYLFINLNLKEGKEFPRISKELKQFLILYFAAMIVSSLFASSLFAGWQNILRQFIFFMTVYIIYSLISSGRTIKYLIGSIIVAALFHTFITIHALYQHNFDIMAFGSDYFLSIGTDLLSHKNTIGIYIFFALIFAFSYHKHIQNKLVKYFNVGIIFVLFLGLLLINSRALILAVLISGFFLLYNLKRKVFYYSLIISAVIISFLFIPPMDELLSLYFRVDEVFAGRDIITNTTMSIIENEWVFGTGPAGTKEYIYKYIPYMLGSPEEIWMRHHFNQIEYGHAHNYFLFMLSDLGILGLLASVFLIYVYMKIGFRVRKYYRTRDPKTEALILAIISIGIGMFARGFLEWGGILAYGILTTDLPFWITFAILIYYDNKRSEEINSLNSQVDN